MHQRCHQMLHSLINVMTHSLKFEECNYTIHCNSHFLDKGDATPWARATNNVKKPMSHVEKLDLRFL